MIPWGLLVSIPKADHFPEMFFQVEGSEMKSAAMFPWTLETVNTTNTMN